MTVLAFGSVRGAPGATTTALLVAGAIEGAVLVEADLAGGVLAVRYGLSREPGLTTFAASSSTEGTDWRSHAQSAGGVPVFVGPDSPESCAALWRGAGDRLATALTLVDTTVVVDVGRVGPSTPMLTAADLVVLLVRPTADHLVTLTHRLAALRRTSGAGHVGVVLVGSGAYRAADVTDSIDVDVLGELPDDPRAASILESGGGTRALARTRLARAAAGLANTLTRGSTQRVAEAVR